MKPSSHSSLCSLILLISATVTGRAGDIDLPTLDRRFDQCTFIATHNSYTTPEDDYTTDGSNQPDSITDQLNYGVRVINLDTWLVRQKRVGPVLGWVWEAYTEVSGGTLDTTVRNSRLVGQPLQVVVGHGLDMPVGADALHFDVAWPTLTSYLDEIAAWVSKHPNDVVAIEFENKIPYDIYIDTNYIQKAIQNSDINQYIFHPDISNPAVPAPGGRARGWSVDRYGYPTLQLLVDHGKTVVFFPPYLPRLDPDGQWKLEVATVYGRECLPPNDLDMSWVEPRGESAPLDDFKRPLFSMIHVPNLPNGSVYEGVSGINRIGLLQEKWEDIRALYDRIPNFLWFDYYDRGYNGTLGGGGEPPAPAMFANYLNDLWKNLADMRINLSSKLIPAPSSYGWNNTDVRVFLSASGPGPIVRAINSRIWRGNGDPNPGSTDNTVYDVQAEGTRTVSFSAVGPLGFRTLTELIDIKIDKTPPTITGSLDRPPDRNGWYASDVTASFVCADPLSNPQAAADTVSGIASCPADVVLSMEGANQSVTGQTIDRASNTGSTTITNINIDKRGPVIRGTANTTSLWPPNGKVVPVIISGTITDALSGVDLSTVKYSVTDDYNRIEPKGAIVLSSTGEFSLNLQLEARRQGNDRNGRVYSVCLKAKDLAGHASQAVLRITVPHDQRSR